MFLFGKRGEKEKGTKVYFKIKWPWKLNYLGTRPAFQAGDVFALRTCSKQYALPPIKEV